MWVLVLILGLILPGVVWAEKLPSPPIQIVGPQGRPIPNATVTVIDSDSLPAVIYPTKAGDIPYSNGTFSLPTTGILQFFADPGVYAVTVSGSGVTKVFVMNIPEEGGTTNKEISGRLDVGTELKVGGIQDGGGKIVCVKTNGDLGTCSSPIESGVCSCL